jgi:large subunit ribosomal protein L13e
LERISIGLPIVNEAKVEEVKVKDVKGEENAYRKLRIARSDARLIGVREKRAKLKAEEAESKKK